MAKAEYAAQRWDIGGDVRFHGVLLWFGCPPKKVLDVRPLWWYFCNSLLLLQHLAMRKDGHRNLSRRERQIMDILYQRGRASAAEIHAALPDPPTYSAVRAKLRVLEGKGHVRHEEESLHYVYVPRVARDAASRSALRHLVSTFFENSVAQAVAALVDLSAADLSREELDHISSLIEKARKEPQL